MKMKFWVTRPSKEFIFKNKDYPGYLSDIVRSVEIWSSKPDKVGRGEWYKPGSFVCRIEILEFKALFGFIPTRGCCRSIEYSVKKIVGIRTKNFVSID